MISGEAYAKVNLGLRVGRRRDDGYHQVDGIFQSVSLVDWLSLNAAEEDEITRSDGGPVVDGLDNLALRAVRAVREQAHSREPVRVRLDKTIPTAAGLGGGSADAAAALGLAGRYFGVATRVLTELAPTLGSDVPFCLRGGTARVSGRGEVVDPLDPHTGFALAVVVPPVEISTPAAFRMWDDMDGPQGLRTPAAALPPSLRAEGDLCNDLYAAATALAPELDYWRTELEHGWGRPVLLSGSGPSLFGFFLDADEAAGAATAVPTGARFAEACEPVPLGWRIAEA